MRRDTDLRRRPLPTRHVLLTLTTVACLLLPASSARAQHDVQVTPDGTTRLISKDVGDERWAIAVDTESGIVTGNVFRADGGAPQFLSCVPQDTAIDPVRLSCRGTIGCDEWVDLGEVELPGSFFQPQMTCDASDAPDTMSAQGARATGAAPASGLRLAPDRRRTLISKDVDGKRWSMVYDHEKGTMTGNVYDPESGGPSFLSCSNVSPGAEVTFACVAATGCGSSSWTPLPDVVLPWSFVHERRCPGGDAPRGLVATLVPSDPQDVAATPGVFERGFASDVAVDGNIAAAGVAEKALYIFERDDQGWHQAIRIPPIAPSPRRPETQPWGRQVAVAGEYVAVSDDGKVRVFERGNGSWTRMSTLALTDPLDGVGDLLMSGGTLAFLTSFADRTRPPEVRIYERSDGAWRRSTTIPVPGRDPVERFGSMSLDGDRLAALVYGGTDEIPSALTRTSVIVYERRGGRWTEAATFEVPDLDREHFNPAIALAGDAMVLGVRRDRPGSNRGGFVRSFVLRDGAWRQLPELESCGVDVGRFGAPLAISGDRLAVAAPSYSEGGNAGEIHLFDRSGDGWVAAGRVRVSDAAVDEIALDGSTLLAGSRTEGTVRVFDLDTADLLPPSPCAPPPPRPQTWPGEQWAVEPAAKHGMNPVLLERAREYAFGDPNMNTQGVVVVRHGVIVAEWYQDGRDADSFAASWSMAKSVSSAVIGIAIDQGLIADASVSMAEFFPDWRGTPKEAISLHNVLQMSSGLLWTEDYDLMPDVLSDIAIMASQERDQLTFAASKPLAVEPGSRFAYSSGDSMLFSGVIESATGMTAGEYARRELFDPIGMSRAEWWSDAVGHTLTYCCIDAPSRDFARFGLLYARNGRWQDRQLLPVQWIRDSFTPVQDADGLHNYGYQWWLDADPTVASAIGWDGQLTLVLPELDLVIVRSGHYDKDPGPPIADPNLFTRYPSAGLVPGRGTLPATGLNTDTLLSYVLDAVIE